MKPKYIMSSLELSDEALDSVVGGITLGESCQNDLIHLTQIPAFSESTRSRIHDLADFVSAEHTPEEISVKWKKIDNKLASQMAKEILIEAGISPRYFPSI